MTESEFTKCSDAALRVTRLLVNEFELDQRGLDEIAIFNVVLKGLVSPTPDGQASETDNPQVDVLVEARELLHAPSTTLPWVKRATLKISSLCNELEEARRCNATQADSIMGFQEEQRALLEALRSVPLLVEAAKGILNVHTWRGKKGYEAALRDGIRELQAAVSEMPDVTGMLLNLNSAPKGETK